MYTQYIGICQRIITICCVCFTGSEVQGSKVERLNKRLKITKSASQDKRQGVMIYGGVLQYDRP